MGEERMRPMGFCRRVRVLASLALSSCAVIAAPTVVMAETAQIGLQEYRGFSDVEPNDWYVSSGVLDYVVDNDLMNGYSGTDLFGPWDNINRGQVACILYNMAGGPDGVSDDFDDVDYSEYYGEAIRWARGVGVINGYAGTNNFGPEDPISREELAAMLSNYAEKIGDVDVSSDCAKLNSVAGSEDISPWAKEIMGWAFDNGILSGDMTTGVAQVNPQSNSQRSQAAKMVTVLHRDILSHGEEPDDDKPENPTVPDDRPSPSEDQYVVTFDSSGGTAVDSQVVKEGDVAELPDDPTNGDLFFAGWFEDENPVDWSAFFDFDTPITGNMTLHALWIDMSTDSDGDGLPDDAENYCGTQTDNADTDGDGLSDYDEKLLFDYDPLDPDSDLDGTRDGDEDHDEDRLTNLHELTNTKTNPILKDSDRDGLSDAEELNTYNTDPTIKDTDGDGASDGDEIRLGTDPLTANNQFQESAGFGEPTESTPVSIDVFATVTGEQVGSIDVAPATSGAVPLVSRTTPGYLGTAYSITMEGQPQSATLSFSYDDLLGTLSDSFQPRIYYVNEEKGILEELPNQTVEDGKVTAPVDHFSTYILLNKVEFDAVWSSEIRPPEDGSEQMAGLDIVLVLDSSGSMNSSDPSRLRVAAAKEFVSKLTENDRAAVIDFDSRAALYQSFTSDKDLLDGAIDKVDASGNTDLSDGMALAIQQFTDESYSRTDAYKYIILLTDGQGGYDSQYTSTAQDNGIVVFTVGLGSGVDADLLTEIAESAGGKYYAASEAEELPDIYSDLSFETVDYTTDTNNDGISDYYTELIKTGELTLGNGSREFMTIDFNYDKDGEPGDDYDKDGVINGDELVVCKSNDKVYLKKVSDPMMLHSDADGIVDSLEHQYGSDPMVNSYPAYAVDYPWEDWNFTYFNIYNQQDGAVKEKARELWSAITFNWDHQDEAKLMMTSFFEEFSNVSAIESTRDYVAMETVDALGEDAIAQLLEKYQGNVEVGSDIYDTIYSTIKGVKDWIAAGHSAKNLSPDFFVQLKARVNLFEYRYANFSTVSRLAGDVADGLSFASAIITDFSDMYQYVSGYSAAIATESAFTQSQDVLRWMADHDDAEEEYVTRAAEDILLIVDKCHGEFLAQTAVDMTVSTVENFASMAAGMLSASNPFVAAINGIISGLDHAFSLSDIAEAGYRLYIVDELVNANKALMSYSSKSSNHYDFPIGNTRHIEMLISARMWGCSLAQTITDNQIYWKHLFETDEIRQEFQEQFASERQTLANCLARL